MGSDVWGGGGGDSRVEGGFKGLGYRLFGTNSLLSLQMDTSPWRFDCGAPCNGIGIICSLNIIDWVTLDRQ